MEKQIFILKNTNKDQQIYIQNMKIENEKLIQFNHEKDLEIEEQINQSSLCATFRSEKDYKKLRTYDQVGRREQAYQPMNLKDVLEDSFRHNNLEEN